MHFCYGLTIFFYVGVWQRKNTVTFENSVKLLVRLAGVKLPYLCISNRGIRNA